MKFNLIFHFWGIKYIEIFFNYTFPSLFFPGNINLLKKYNTTLTFCILSSDLVIIQNNLKKFDISKFKIKFVYIDNIVKTNEKKKINHLVILEGFKSEKRSHKDIYFLILCADDLFSNDNIRSILKVLKIKKISGILENKILIDKENITKYKKLFSNKRGITKKKLVSIGINNISKINKFSFPKIDRKFNYNSYSLFWKDGKNLICRGYLLHTLLIKPFKNISNMRSFHDYFLFPEYIKSFDKIYIFKDSNDFFRIGLTDKVKENFIFNFNALKFSQVLTRWTTEHHRKYPFNETIFRTNNQKINNKILFQSLKDVKQIDNLLKSKKPKKHNNHPWWNSKSEVDFFRNSKNYIKSYLLRFI